MYIHIYFNMKSEFNNKYNSKNSLSKLKNKQQEKNIIHTAIRVLHTYAYVNTCRENRHFVSEITCLSLYSNGFYNPIRTRTHYNE